eukprot:scaffold5718_cov265-Chaetoceros_neogracile.AAC.16
MDDDECLLIDVKVTVGNCDAYATKHLRTAGLGKMCYPICKPCLDKEKTIITYPTKKTNQSKKRKEGNANKATAAAAKKAKKRKTK